MSKRVFALLLTMVIASPGAAPAGKEALDASIRSRADASWDVALKIWSWAEVGYKETKSSAILAEALREGGFKVETGVAGIPTAFVAAIGSGGPVIGMLAEYDALPGLSQQAVPEPRSKAGLAAGHGCGPHLFGTAVVSAGLALAEQVSAGTLKGTLRCTAARRRRGEVRRRSWPETGSSTTATPPFTGTLPERIRPATNRALLASP
jgi:aminobenzoyl-glutamate utilization protein B